METDDANEALPTPSSTTDSSSSAQRQPPQRQQQVVSSTVPDPTNAAAAAPTPPAATTSSSSAAPAVTPPVTVAADLNKALGDVDKHRVQLEALELEITGELTAAQYAELLLIYLVQLKLIEAKYCYLRAAEKFKEPLLKDAWKIGAAAAKVDYGTALQLCRAANFGPVLKPLIAELTNRLTALQLETVAKAYTSVELETLADLLGLAKDSEQLARLIAGAGWRVDAGFVLPAETPQCRAFAAQLIDAAFGEFRRPAAKKQRVASAVSSSDVEVLKKLVNSSDFFDSHATA